MTIKDKAMSSEFFTLHDFMGFTKGVIYLLILASLVGIGLFWRFLTGGDND